MVDSIKLPAPGKLNLFLHVMGRRADGYHQLQTLFQFIDLADELEFVRCDHNQIEVEGDLIGVSAEQNLIYKAAKLLQQQSGVEQGVRIFCKKRLPVGGGVGGGSSDAATTLVGLNHLWGCEYTSAQLQSLGLQLGADVPIFIYGQSAFAKGVGEVFTAAEPPESYYLLLQPEACVSTAKIFSHLALTRDTSAIKMSACSPRAMGNDLQSIVCQLYPEVAACLDWLSQRVPARMTGSGSVVFAEFSTEDEAKALAKKVPNRYKAYVCKGCNQSPLQMAVSVQYWGVAKR